MLSNGWNQVWQLFSFSLSVSMQTLKRVRVQENPDEIPSGALPRSIDIILRHEQVKSCFSQMNVSMCQFFCFFFVCALLSTQITFFFRSHHQCQVEKAKPGDRLWFSGTLIVVPDVSRYQLGVSATVKRSRDSGGGGGASGAGAVGGGVRGIKGTGVQVTMNDLVLST